MVVKEGNFHKAPEGCIFKVYRYWYTDLLIEVEFDSVSEYLPDDPDKFAGILPEGIVMRPAFRHLFFIVSFEGGIILYNVMCCVDECVSVGGFHRQAGKMRHVHGGNALR